MSIERETPHGEKRRVFYFTDSDGNRVGADCQWFVAHALNDALLYGDLEKLNIAIDNNLSELFDHPEHLKKVMAGGIVRKGRKSSNFDKEKAERNRKVWQRLHYWRGYGKENDPTKPLPIKSNGPDDACSRVQVEFPHISIDAIYKIYLAMKDTTSAKEGAGRISAWFYERKGRSDRAFLGEKKG